MGKRLVVVAASVCAVCMTLLVGVAETQSTSGTGPETHFPKAARDAADKILRSPRAESLSGSGRHALNVVSGRLASPGEAGSRDQSLQAAPSIASPPFESSRFDVIVNDPDRDSAFGGNRSSQNETAVAGYNDNIVVAYNDYNTGATDSSLVGYSFSSDGGATFTGHGAMPRGNGYVLGDPALTVDRSGNFYAAFIYYLFGDPGVSTIGVSKSVDGGRTFSSPVLIPEGTLISEGSFGDKEFIAVDTTNGPHRGNVYVTFTNYDANRLAVSIFLSRSTDGGATFSDPVLVSSREEFLNDTAWTQGSEPAVGPNGEVYVSYWSFPLASYFPLIMVAKSTDGGQTFGAPVVVTGIGSIGFNNGTISGGFRVNNFPRIDTNPVNGQVYITYADRSSRAFDSADIFFTRSTNGGATWSAARRLNRDDTITDQFFPDVAVNDAGKIEVMWYDRRRDPNENMRLDIYRADSTDGGLTFKSDRRVTSVSFTPSVNYETLAFMGDYNDIKSITRPSGRGEDFLLAWTDCRRLMLTGQGARLDQDVFFSRKSANGDDDR